MPDDLVPRTEPRKPALDYDAPLVEWERQFAVKLAYSMGKITKSDEKAIASSCHPNKSVSLNQLRRTKAKTAFQQAYVDARAEVVDLMLKKGRQDVGRLALKGIKVHERALNVVGKAMKSEKPMEAIAAARAVAPLTTPLIDRVAPKKEEHKVETNIRITLTTHQAARIEAPEMLMEAVEVPYEVIATEQVSE